MRITRILLFLGIGQKKSLDLKKQSISSIERRQLFLQFAFALIANVGNISPGMSMGFSAVALPHLQNKNATFQMDESQASWTASLATISTLLGSLICGDMLDRLGRKATLLFQNVPCMLGWLLIAFAGGKSTLGMIYAGRVLTGLSLGFVNAATVYSTEMASDSLRGVFISWAVTAASVGILLMYVLGYIIQDNWKLLAEISTIFPICAIILTFLFLPETPSWLYSKGRTKEVEKSLKKIRGIPTLQEMTPSVQNEFKILTDKYNKTPGDDIPQKNFRQLIFRSETIKPFIIMNLFLFFQQVSGIYVVIFYAVNIAKEAGVTWDPYLVTILIGLARVVLNVAASFVSKRFGRRKPSIASGTGMTISMGALAVFLYLQSTNTISEEAAQSLTWIPAICLIMHIATSTIGFLTMPWAMIGEVYPSEIRGVAAGLTGGIANGFSFIILKLYPGMLHAFGKFGVFTFYGVSSAVGTAFVFFFLPETEGKSLQEIEESFSEKKKNEQTHF